MLPAKLPPHAPGIRLGAALRAWFRTGSPAQQTRWRAYLDELAKQDKHGPMLPKLLDFLLCARIGLDHNLLQAGLLAENTPAAFEQVARQALGKRTSGGGRPPKSPAGRTVALGVGNVAPDVATLVKASAEPTAYVEAAVRFYAAHLDSQS